MLLNASPFPQLNLVKSGKVRELFDLGSEYLIVSTDRISAFDVIMENGIPDKGKILNQMSAYWFERLARLIPNHVRGTSEAELAKRVPAEYLELLNGRATIARKTVPIGVECVARGYITGSLYKEYIQHGPDVHGLKLPEGLLDGSKLPEPIFTPATKADSGHDINISYAQTEDLVGVETTRRLREMTLAIYAVAKKHSEEKGIILADTKFEFGFDGEELIWIDEALTPDSSRFWDMKSWEPGRAQPSYDKQFVRDYLESVNWNKFPPGPRLPMDVVEKTRAKYLEAFEKLTGTDVLYI
ncbi:MAG: phosphoribosylaminoimidazolesuccinocarboxamide synthase [Armatimonadetes bacterium]|nr:phosphoribosylaminoimidazolesuccinocarboxamide synthase [Armatimonadota bacterium]